MPAEARASVTPEALALRAVAALRGQRGGSDRGATWRVKLLLGADAAPERRREYADAVRDALAAFPELRGAAVVTRRPSGLAESRVEVEVRSLAFRLQERDRELLGFLGIARYLSTAQVAALLFPGRHFSVPLRRLNLLASAAGGALVRGDHFPGERERVRVWALTPGGKDVADGVTALPADYSTDPVKAQFLEHLVWLNELLVALWLRGGTPASPSRAPFRWVCDTGHALPFRTRAADGSSAVGHVAPDAVLELPAARRRVFVEAERGTHTIVPLSPAKTGATVVKLDRYAAFFGDVVDVRNHTTAYLEQFPDAFAPELVFMVPSATRRDHVRQAVDERRRKDPRPPQFDVQVLTLDEARDRYAALLPGRPEPRMTTVASVPAPMPVLSLAPTELASIRSAFNALVRRARAAQAAGAGGLTATEMEALGAARAALARLEGIAGGSREG
jgi:hypothetical protein